MIISVAHDKGGVGKTTIASNLVAHYAATQTIDAIDLDPKGHLTRFLSRRHDDHVRQQHVRDTAALRKAVETDRLMIIDIGGMDTDLTRHAIAYSDLIITPVADSQVEVDGLIDFAGVIRRLRSARPDLRATVLLNRVHPAAKRSVELLREFVSDRDELEIFRTIIRDRADWKNAYASAKSVAEYQLAGKAAAEFSELLKEIEEKKNGKV